MIKKSFINTRKPVLKYETINNISAYMNIAIPDIVNMLIENDKSEKITIKEGDEFLKGEKIIPFDDSLYLVSSVTGRVAAIKNFDGNFGKKYCMISIKTAEQEQEDISFSEKADQPSISNFAEFLAYIPGGFPAELLTGRNNIKKILISGLDNDLLTVTNQYILKSRISDIKEGIEILKNITDIEDITVLTPQYLEKTASILENTAKVITIDSVYPSAMPELILKRISNKEVLSNRFEEEGIVFISAEAIASVGQAYRDKKIPVTKLVTLVKKNGSKILINTRVGVSVKELCSNCGISIKDKDRIIVGGPMRGISVYIEDYPVLNDTDTIIIQDSDDINYVSDYPCINCGECVNICPANVQVNMLIRFLEVGRYETAADEYDLFSCIECGLCSYVCISNIPIFQYITLAKHEIMKTKAMEASK